MLCLIFLKLRRQRANQQAGCSVSWVYIKPIYLFVAPLGGSHSKWRTVQTNREDDAALAGPWADWHKNYKQNNSNLTVNIASFPQVSGRVHLYLQRVGRKPVDQRRQRSDCCGDGGPQFSSSTQISQTIPRCFWCVFLWYPFQPYFAKISLFKCQL